MSEEYKVGDKFTLNHTDGIYVLARIDEDDLHLFVEESKFVSGRDYYDHSFLRGYPYAYEWEYFDNVTKIEETKVPQENQEISESSNEEDKSPAEKLGYKLGDMFIIVSKQGRLFDEDWEVGDTVVFVEDDGSDWPKFKITNKPDVFNYYQYVSLSDLVKIENDKTEYINTLEPPLEVKLTIEDNLTKLTNLLKEVSNYDVAPSLYIQPCSGTIKYSLTIDSFEFEFKDIDEVINKLNQFLTSVGE